MVERRPPNANDFPGRTRASRAGAPRTAIPRPKRAGAAPTDAPAGGSPGGQSDAPQAETEPLTSDPDTSAEFAAELDHGSASAAGAHDHLEEPAFAHRRPRGMRGRLLMVGVLAVAALTIAPIAASSMKNGSSGASTGRIATIGGGLSSDRDYGYYTNRSYDGNRWDDSEGAYVDPSPDPLRDEIVRKEQSAPDDFWDPWGNGYGGVGRGLDRDYRSLSRFEPNWRDAATRAYGGSLAPQLQSARSRAVDVDPFDLALTGTDITDPMGSPFPYAWADMAYNPYAGYSNPYLNRLRLDGYGAY